MGFFDDQVRLRKKNDEELFNNSVDKIYSDVLGESRRSVSADRNNLINVVNEVLSYYHYKKVSIPTSLSEDGEIIEYAANYSGMMTCRLELEGQWHMDSLGPLKGFAAS